MHSHNIHSPATVNYPTSPRRKSLPPSCHQYSGNIQRLFIDHSKIFMDFFACRIVLAANHQYPGNIRRLSGQQQQPSAAINYRSQQQQPAAAINYSNQQQQPAAAINYSNQQQQPAAATSSNQQQPAAATSSSNQQQQSTVATGISNQHSSYQQHLHNQRWPPLVINTVPSRRYPASSWPRTSCPVTECNHRTDAHFGYLFTFLNFPFCVFSLFC